MVHRERRCPRELLLDDAGSLVRRASAQSGRPAVARPEPPAGRALAAGDCKNDGSHVNDAAAIAMDAHHAARVVVAVLLCARGAICCACDDGTVLL